jgi:hypothetical protein
VRGGEGRDRTADTAVFSRVLYRLSYLPGSARRPLVRAPDGLRSGDLRLDRASVLVPKGTAPYGRIAFYLLRRCSAS